MTYPCFAVCNAALSIVRNAKVDQPLLWICDIITQPDSMTNGRSLRFTFRVISWMPI